MKHHSALEEVDEPLAAVRLFAEAMDCDRGLVDFRHGVDGGIAGRCRLPL